MDLQQSLILILIMAVIIFLAIYTIRLMVMMVLSIMIKKISNRLEKRHTENARLNKDEKKLGDVYVNVTRLTKLGEPELKEPNYNLKEVVGIAKPIGRFTSMIMGQKISYLIQHMKELKNDINRDENGATINKFKIHAHDSLGKGMNHKL